VNGTQARGLKVKSGVGGFDEVVADGNFAGGKGAGDEGIAKLGLTQDGELGTDDHGVSEGEVATEDCRVGSFEAKVISPGFGFGKEGGTSDAPSRCGVSSSFSGDKRADFFAEGGNFVGHESAKVAFAADDLVDE